MIIGNRSYRNQFDIYRVFTLEIFKGGCYDLEFAGYFPNFLHSIEIYANTIHCKLLGQKL